VATRPVPRAQQTVWSCDRRAQRPLPRERSSTLTIHVERKVVTMRVERKSALIDNALSGKGCHRSTVLVWVSSLISTVALSADSGIWVKSGPFAQVNLACSQVWECQAKQDVLHSDDTYVWHTPNKLTWGVCSAGAGAADSCNECAVNPPDEPCTWELRKKQ
jgi:hypothetical protein